MNTVVSLFKRGHHYHLDIRWIRIHDQTEKSGHQTGGVVLLNSKASQPNWLTRFKLPRQSSNLDSSDPEIGGLQDVPLPVQPLHSVSESLDTSIPHGRSVLTLFASRKWSAS